MFVENEVQCVSFHWSKILGIMQGGAILHDLGEEFSGWLKCARFDGRGPTYPHDLEDIRMIGWHCRMSPEVAAEGLVRLSLLPRHNEDLPTPEYPDLSKLKVFFQ
jgi:dTDP-4-amino-4,6-dideoxygalactose transaminase